MNNQLLKSALGLYGRSILSAVMGVFMWVSIGVIAMAMVPDGQVMTVPQNLTMNLIALAVQGFLFVVIVYSYAWRLGDKVGTQKLFQGESGDPHFGLKMALVAGVPSFAAYMLLIADKLFGLLDGYLMLYRVLNASLYPIMVWTLGMDWSRTTADVPWVGILLTVIPLVLMVVLSWVGYYLGYKQIAVGQRLMYGNKLR